MANKLPEQLPEKLRGNIEGVIKQAQESVGEEEMIMPMAFIGNDEKVTVCALDFHNDEAKTYCANMIRKLAKEMNAEFVFFVSESWMSKLSEAEMKMHERTGMRVSERHDRIDCVLFQLESVYGNYMAMCEIEMKDGKRTIKDPEFSKHDTGGMTGRLMNLLPAQQVH